MRRRPAAPSIVPLVALLLVVGACGPTASTPPATSPPGSGPAPASPGPSAPEGTIDSPEEAAQLVIASDPRFAGLDLRPYDPDLIGACCWYEAEEADGGYQVTIVVGWGDCPSGCIEEHRWSFAVTPDGRVTPTGESGDPVPPGPLPPGEGS